MRCLLALVALAMLGTGAAWAQTYYKWIDAQGVTHYSEQRPPTTKAKPVHVRGTQGQVPAAPATAAAPATMAGDLKAATDDFRKQACAAARNNLQLLSGSSMVLDTGTVQHPDGVTTATKLSAEQRVAATVEARHQITQYCDRG
ncbi:DUF4124 domain-containing protein [Rhodanobacter ginsenosidimutans]|jgi:hypothetical protein|uniref:DUF4124 domain-containing protein n=1 Tax=Rhodanobacter ginsenosidimutans TaxID=490571 RepID=A0ABW0JTP7_9GAMM